jgi:hypothetical protein
MGYRKSIISNYKTAMCGICSQVDKVSLFDVDHKIPQWAGGPDEPWNLWTLCLKHHRLKTLTETSLRKNITNSYAYCFSCKNTYSKYFSFLWCGPCSKLLLSQRVESMEHIYKNEYK